MREYFYNLYWNIDAHHRSYAINYFFLIFPNRGSKTFLVLINFRQKFYLSKFWELVTFCLSMRSPIKSPFFFWIIEHFQRIYQIHFIEKKKIEKQKKNKTKLNKAIVTHKAHNCVQCSFHIYIYNSPCIAILCQSPVIILLYV